MRSFPIAPAPAGTPPTRACHCESSAAAGRSTPRRRMRSACCARAAAGHVAATPPIRVMKSRRLIASPRLRITPNLVLNSGHQIRKERLAKWGSGVKLRCKNPEPRSSRRNYRPARRVPLVQAVISTFWSRNVASNVSEFLRSPKKTPLPHFALLMRC
jgi:hypothetical protein